MTPGVIHNGESLFFGHCISNYIAGLLMVSVFVNSIKNNYGKSVINLVLFIRICDQRVKITSNCMVNSFMEPQTISAFRKITNSTFVVVNCRYESLHCHDRFVMKQITNHEICKPAINHPADRRRSFHCTS